MFILYAVVVGLLVGLLAGGRLAGIAQIRFRSGWLIFLGFGAQVVLFSPPVTERIGGLSSSAGSWVGPSLYVASTAVVLVALLRNVAQPGLPVVALGAISNFLAIVANGGYMPASAGALAALGKVHGSEFTNSAVIADPALAPLTDVFAMPAGVPFANVFSIGDVLIAIGIGVAIAVAMRAGRPVVRPGNSPVRAMD